MARRVCRADMQPKPPPKPVWDYRGRSGVTRESVQNDLLRAAAMSQGMSEEMQTLIDGSGRTVSVPLVKI